MGKTKRVDTAKDKRIRNVEKIVIVDKKPSQLPSVIKQHPSLLKHVPKITDMMQVFIS